MILSPLWLISQPVDFEHKQYMLLGYLQAIERHFLSFHVSPHHRELAETKDMLEAFSKKRRETFASFKAHMSKFNHTLTDTELRQIQGEPEATATSETVTKIIEFSIPILKESLRRCAAIWDFAVDTLLVDFINNPDQRERGIVFFHVEGDPTVEVFYFKVAPTYVDSTKYRGFVLRKNSDVPAIMIVGTEKCDFAAVSAKYLTTHRFKSEPLMVSVQGDLDLPREQFLHPVMKHEIHDRITKSR